MRCTSTTQTGKRCRWPATHLVGGVAVCDIHHNQAVRLWNVVRDSLPADVRQSAERDTRERSS